MVNRLLPVSGPITFEELKKTNKLGAEYWSARELQPLLGDGQWRRIENAINRTMVSCSQLGNNPDYHFAGAGKMIGTGKGAVWLFVREKQLAVITAVPYHLLVDQLATETQKIGYRPFLANHVKAGCIDKLNNIVMDFSSDYCEFFVVITTHVSSV